MAAHVARRSPSMGDLLQENSSFVVAITAAALWVVLRQVGLGSLRHHPGMLRHGSSGAAASLRPQIMPKCAQNEVFCAR